MYCVCVCVRVRVCVCVCVCVCVRVPACPAAVQHEDSDDGLPDTLNPDEVTDKRYKGGHIPSKVFKTLQKAVGDETPETPPNGELC